MPRRVIRSSRKERSSRGNELGGKDTQRNSIDLDMPLTSSSSNPFSFNRDNPFQYEYHTAEATNSATENEQMVVPQINPQKIVLGLDYGTTFSSISYRVHPIDAINQEPVHWEVKSIANWPDAGAWGPRMQVPTESWYSSAAPTRDPVSRGSNQGRISVTGTKLVDDTDDTDVTDYTSDDNEHHHQRTESPVNGSFDILRDQNSDATLDVEHSSTFLWGYSVPYEQYSANSDRDPWGLVRYAKSKLLDTKYTDRDRQILEPVIDELMNKKLIRPRAPNGSSDPLNAVDIFTDFLTQAFIHTRTQLEALQIFSEGSTIQFVMTVPTIWKSQSSRILQKAMAASIKASGFGKLDHGCIDNLIIISEPEAAATYLMATTKMMSPDETFVLLDCGGGTVDAITFTVDTAYPLRLRKEEVAADGDNCGGSYANLNFRHLVEKRLENETYLFTNGETKETIVNRLMPVFEDDYKRRYDAMKRCWHRIRIPGLIGDDERPQEKKKRFQKDHLIMDNSDYNTIFRPLLDRIVTLLSTQLELVHEKRRIVKKVFLVGGFGEAPSVRTFLELYLKHMSRNLDYEIKLITDKQNAVTAVSAGAVLREHNMEDGPDRIAQSSYGILRNEPYSPKTYAGHDRGTPYFSELDGEEYVTTVNYFMFKTMEVPSKKQFASYTCIHTFPINQKRLLCEEVLYVLDREAKSHYTREDAMNAGIEVAGRIIIDMTWLREKKLIRAFRPQRRGKLHYRVVYDLVALVEGRNLKYEARYPAGAGGKSQVQKSKQVSIAAAFVPGTK